ncbi:MAG: drug resistance transporter, EmrB/QacA subfamily [Frankiales bacterium]|jgi:EmrB/QacA subfamily drug resistance transporter|nr:drug resistance transporter, EmrB/QacA subfamily [Frankiales bacterium]
MTVLANPAPAPEAAVPAATDAIAPHAWKVLAVSAAAVYVVFLDATIVNIAFPAISASFPTVTRSGLSWVLNAYAVVFGALLVTAGGLADDRGRKRVFLAGLVVFAGASALCGVAPTVPLLVAARAFQAVGGALLVPASLALLLPEFPLSKRATAVGLWGAVGAVAAATGPSIGALLVEGPGWRWVFYVNLPFCAVAWWYGRRLLVESRGSSGTRPDLFGVALVTSVFGLLSLALVQGESWGWGSLRTVGCFAGAAALAPALVIRGLTASHPALPVRLFRHRSFTAATAGTLLYGTAFYGQILCNVLFLNGVWHYSILRTAVAILPSPLVAAAVAPVAGRLADRYGYRTVIVPGAALFALGSLYYGWQTTLHPHYLTAFLPASLLAGLSIGAAFSTLGAAASQSLPPTQFGVGSAVSSMARQLGAVIGVAVLVAVLGTPSPAQALGAFHDAWHVTALFAAACTVVSWAIPKRV